LAYALQCGVGTSARVLARRPDAARMLKRWSPDALVDDLAAHEAAKPASAVAGIHLFPFGGLDAALDWRARSLAASHAPGDAS
jgi:methylenetetrahydrofolate reductase (NADPH)